LVLTIANTYSKFSKIFLNKFNFSQLHNFNYHALSSFYKLLSMTLAQFKALYDQYYTSIKNFVYYKCGDVDLAEDVTQDSFMKL